ncbi:hypothetical protein ACQPZF_37990 [Actinosynnema sp. CS-041913]|uniref:hypothetical protein n=1 Tax=Actinosynnema sp. CS-041913 TaxID=3239917 RepID=UPI003D8A485A
MSKKVRLCAALGAFVLAGQALTASIASAQPAQDAGKEIRHCAIGLQPRAADYRPGQAENENPQVDCFATIAEAVEFASAGRIPRARLAGVKGPEELLRIVGESDAVTNSARIAANPLLGIHYDYTDYGGGSHTYYGENGTGCSTGITYGVGYVGDSWNDDFASGRSYSNCQHTMYEHLNYGGANNTWWNTSNYGALAEEITSIVYHSSH